MRDFLTFWIKPRGAPYWRPFIWATGLAGAVGIPLILAYPYTAPYIWLWLVGIPANSPVSPLFPTAFEPLMMEVVKYRSVLSVALVATGIFVYMEFVNWWVFSWVLHWGKLEKLRANRWVRWGLKNYARAPLRTVFIFAATPIPFWVARSLAVLHGTPFWPYMAVMGVGRFPRLFIYAWLGAQLRVPTVFLVTLAAGTGVILITWKLARGEKILQDSVLDRSPGEDRPGPERQEETSVA